MERQPVSSSQIASAGFDPKAGILEVEFRGGSVYQYQGVSDEQFKELVNAESPGRYLNQNIKPTYPYTKVS